MIFHCLNALCMIKSTYLVVYKNFRVIAWCVNKYLSMLYHKNSHMVRGPRIPQYFRIHFMNFTQKNLFVNEGYPNVKFLTSPLHMVRKKISLNSIYTVFTKNISWGKFFIPN